MARPGIRQDRKFRRLSRALESEPLACGCLELIWHTCYEDGSDYVGDSDDVESAAGWTGERGKLTTALVEAGGAGNAGFIEELSDRPGHYIVHDFFDHAPQYVQKRREREIARKQRGKSISDVRREAANKSHQSRRRKADDGANVQLTAASEIHSHTNILQTAANGLTPAPAPTPIRTSWSEPIGSDHVDFALRRKGPRAPSQEACMLAALLESEIRRNKADYRMTSAQLWKWEMTADRMLRLDERTPDQIATLIRWVQQDQFWMSNVLSMDKLREKWDQLEMKREAANGNNGGCRKVPHVVGSALDNHRALLEGKVQ